MHKSPIMVASLSVLAVCGFSAGSRGEEPQVNTLHLAQDGKPKATIVIAPDATRAAQFAAHELRYHLNRITGGDFAIVTNGALAKGTSILVGDSQATRTLGISAADFGLQEYLIRFLPAALVLVGRDKPDRGQVVYDYLNEPNAFATWPDFWDEQGTMHAVYDFLERFCDVRWFTHTESGLVCPENKDLAVKGSEVRRAPRFRYRYASYHGSGGYDGYTSLWPAGSDGFKRWEQAAYPDAHARGNYAVAKAGCVQLFRLRMREGGEMCACNHSLYGYYHRFWEPSDQPEAAKAFVAKRADFFAQGYPEGTQPPQMCYTSTGLIEQVAQDAVAYFKGESTSIGLRKFQWGENYFAVEPMDNSSFCKCPACQELIGRVHSKADRPGFSRGRDSDYFFNFVNEVAKRVKKTNPDKRVVALAYMTHAWPPESLQLDPSVAVQFCFAANRSPYARGEYENDLQALKAWADEAKETDRPLYLWLYYCFPKLTALSGKFNTFPGFFAHTIGEQFRLFDRYGYRGMFFDGYGQEVEAYVTYRLMNEPTLDVDDLLAEFFSRYYGAAAEPMRRFYDEVESTYVNPANYPERAGGMNPLIAWGRLGTKERMEKLAKLLDDAKALAKTDVEKKRVELFELGTWAYMAEGRAKYEERVAAPMPSMTAPVVADAGGDPAKVDWSQAAELGGGWFACNSDKPAPRQLAGRMAHDGKHLYVELSDSCDTTKLVVSPLVCCYDDWELFTANQRGLPSRQFLVGPTGQVLAYLNGEVNWRMTVPHADHGIKAAVNTKAQDKWVTRLSIPLKEAVPGGAKPGDTIYLNIVRVASPAVSGEHPYAISTWVSHTTVHTLDRLAEVTLGSER